MWNTTSPVPATSASTHVHPGAVASPATTSLVPAPPRHLSDVRPESCQLISDLLARAC
jgi:hypothetical protein